MERRQGVSERRRGGVLAAAVGFAAVLACAGCASQKAYHELELALKHEKSLRIKSQQQLRELQQKLRQRGIENPEALRQRLELEEEVAKLRHSVARLEQEKVQLLGKLPQAEGEVTFEFPSEVVEKLRLSVNEETHGLILDHDLLFGSSGTALTAEAKRLLRTLAEALNAGTLAGHFIMVDGHTDSRPVRRNLALNPDNWVLGARRAAAVLRALVEGGVDPARLTLRSFAYKKPLSKRRPESPRNRRVEIVVGPALPERGGGTPPK